MASVGRLKRIREDAFRVAGAVQETCIPEMLGGQGHWFAERGCVLEHQIFTFAKIRCSTSYDLASFFRHRRNTFGRWNGTIARRIDKRWSALHWIFHFGRKSRRIASFLMLSTSKIEEVSQTSFAFDAVKFQNWGSLADLLRFRCTVVKSKIEEVSQNSFVFKQADRQKDKKDR